MSEITRSTQKFYWSHAPCHRFNEAGTYMITASTLHKELLFKTPQELDLLQNALFQLSLKYNWRLEAWAIFPNHYHMIAQSPADPTNLKKIHLSSPRFNSQNY